MRGHTILEILEGLNDFCMEHADCEGCPLLDGGCDTYRETYNPQKIVEVVTEYLDKVSASKIEAEGAFVCRVYQVSERGNRRLIQEVDISDCDDLTTMNARADAILLSVVQRKVVGEFVAEVEHIRRIKKGGTNNG